MRRTPDHALFIALVETMSFHKAAQQLDISTSALSRQFKKLEQQLGVTLLNRTTRSISLTNEGDVYYHSCLRIEEEIKTTQQKLHNLNSSPVGKLKITVTPTFMFTHLHRLITDFGNRYPDISFELLISDQPIDLAEAGIDVAIRIGQLHDSRYRCRRIMSSTLEPCASRVYLLENGSPANLSDLVNHRIISSNHLYSVEKRQRLLAELDLEKSSPTITANDVLGIYKLVKAGAGISFLPRYLINDDVARGEIETILPNTQRTEHHVYALFSASPHLPLKTRVFLDYIAEELSLES